MKSHFKTKINLILLLFIAQFSFAQVFTQNYDAGITKELVLENVKLFENEIGKYDYSFTKSNIKSPYEYEATWKKNDEITGLQTVKMKYKFSEKSAKVEIVKISHFFNNSDHAVTPEENTELYNSNKNVFVNMFFKIMNFKE
ncbi:hypothetical protein [Halpernia sp.]|uniref:hypothetical protein n=1 Tax=Halpernia sp. TaxID=2782209 RepID=UPI003A90C2E5